MLYYAFECPTCHNQYPFATPPTGQPGEPPQFFSEQMLLQCPRCNTNTAFLISEKITIDLPQDIPKEVLAETREWLTYYG